MNFDFNFINLLNMTKINHFFIGCICFCSCKKDYTYVCSNPYAAQHDFYNIVNNKKKVAEQKYKDYADATYANTSINKMSCEIKTK